MRKRTPMPHGFEALAQYNAETYRGLIHTPEHDAKMAESQREFNEWAARDMAAPVAHGRRRIVTVLLLLATFALPIALTIALVS